jgi:hypothetical protein
MDVVAKGCGGSNKRQGFGRASESVNQHHDNYLLRAVFAVVLVVIAFSDADLGIVLRITYGTTFARDGPESPHRRKGRFSFRSNVKQKAEAKTKLLHISGAKYKGYLCQTA